MDGLILVNKTEKLTSHDVVVKIRNILNINKIGHFGTLDPLATGLILVAAGKATRLFPFYSKANKTYKGEIRLGFSTDTYDSTGKPTSVVKKEYPNRSVLVKAIKEFEGEILQVPPPYSAKKYRGRPLYVLARGKKEFELKPNKVFIHFFRLIKYNPSYLNFEVKCSSGTYIRSFAHDLGQCLGCGAHLTKLTRTEAGNFHIKDCLTIEKIKKLTEEGKIDKFLIPLEFLLCEFPKIILKKGASPLVKNGNIVHPENISKIIPADPSPPGILHNRDDVFRIFNLEGRFLALARKVPDKNYLHPFLVISSKENRR